MPIWVATTYKKNTHKAIQKKQQQTTLQYITKKTKTSTTQGNK